MLTNFHVSLVFSFRFISDVIIAFLLEGPTSYAPVIEAAIDIVEKSRGQFHVLVVIADGQVHEMLPLLVCMLFKSCS